MKEKPILFSVPMVRALLDGRKTMTRRIVPGITDPDLFECLTDGAGWIHSSRCQSFCDYACGGVDAKAKYKTGDVLWVREATIVIPTGPTLVGYVADGCKVTERYERQRPSIHMARAHCRLRLRVTAVKAERVQDISEEDAIREGLFPRVGAAGTVLAWNSPAVECGRALAVDAFRDLWNSINGPGSWAANPWVWCYTFEVMKATP